MLTLVPGDVYSQLRPRHMCRRQRRPGVRERHATQRERHSPGTRIKMSFRPTTAPVASAYCTQSGIEYNKHARATKQASQEPEIRATSYKELSTIEEIRAEIRSTEKPRPKTSLPHIPSWMLDLDVNLDVSAVDVIPPFETEKPDQNNTYTQEAKVTLVYDSDESDHDIDSLRSEELISDYRKSLEVYDNKNETITSTGGVHSNIATGQRHIFPEAHGFGSTKDKRSPSRTGKFSTIVLQGKDSAGRSRSASPSGKSATMVIRGRGESSPRRYQGDMRVMSMQQGGIRSTPMQPKSKKFINQMLTYTHMKVHEKKIRVVKPAVDTKMPKTYKIAQDRKRLVEQRLSGSFDRSLESPSHSRSSMDTSRSKVKNR